ncbi:homoserine dehydrogenase [Desulfatitalea alkaliphila]|uniref:Homoserine dehydrogenase n=1 Tax=Desulfatitalea alkaliphila TaxID=2929485 RepID=A0AA41R620_9BACT|nr:homoserine dehydrogenase [Desulfatitalea alkaliphila]MCJ8502372.1 homoserine dehydrogenase [Desulfatitalea alkaliphila]
MQPVKLGLIGCGTVGTGVARLLIEHRQLLADRTGIPLDLKYVADLDRRTDRGVTFPPGVFIDDAWTVVNDPEVDIVIEMIGGLGAAKELIEAAIAKGKQIVTANKALLATHGNELMRAAADAGVDLAYEASVGGCMPIVKSLREALVANEIHGMVGILNGTCNYILSQITATGMPFEQALAGAQANGYAEADPTLDVEGIDTAHKLAILSALAFGMRINLDDIYIEGISTITPLDIQFARDFGYRIKLLAICKNHGDRVEARVHPAMIPEHNILSHVSGSLNAITISGHAVDDLFLSGHGAGMLPTASAVLSDIIDLARNLRRGKTGRVPLMGYQPDRIQPVPVMPMDDIVVHYYIRFSVQDRPGVLAAIAGILGDNAISIQSVQQKDRKTNGWVPIVMLTHHAKEANIRKALREIGALSVVGPAPMLIRIEDPDARE